MKRPIPNQEYVVKLKGRDLVHAISGLHAYSKSISEKEAENEGGEYEDIAVVENIVIKLRAAIDEQTPGE